MLWDITKNSRFPLLSLSCAIASHIWFIANLKGSNTYLGSPFFLLWQTYVLLISSVAFPDRTRLKTSFLSQYLAHFLQKVPCFLQNLRCFLRKFGHSHRKVAYFLQNVPCFLQNLRCFLQNVPCFLRNIRNGSRVF